ncbi:sugar transferase [Ilumatobacter coccineus]|nr:sugar transferase [Ilumatobacter coccineus]
MANRRSSCGGGGSMAETAAHGSETPNERFRLVQTEIPNVENGQAEGLERSPSPMTPSVIRRRLMLADASTLLFAIALAFVFQAIAKPVPWFIVTDHLLLVVVSLPAFALGAGFNHLYQARANERRLEEASNILKALGFGISVILIIAFGVQFGELSRLWIAALAVSVTSCMLIERRIVRFIFRRLRREGSLLRRIVIVGTDDHAIALKDSYERNPTLGYEVVGFAGVVGHEQGAASVLGSVEDLIHVLEKHDAVGVVVSLASIASDAVNRLTRQLTDHGYHVALSSSLRDIDLGRLRPQTLDGQTMIYVEPTVRNGWRSSAKRVLDVGLASVLMLVTLPLQIIAALAVAVTSKGPVFFRQIRVGKDGELFELLKFRTMRVDAEDRKAGLMDQNEADGPLFKIQDDPRITPVGRLLRKFSIDELPQLFCVLIGSMSMVGPRPALPTEVEQWDHEVRERLRVLPGLTGMWQVSGRSDSSFEVYKRMDLYYVDNWSLLHDLKICARTVKVVLTGRGAA